MSVAWVVGLVVVWFSAGAARANSAPLPVAFAGTARELPQAEIRVAIATELSREVLAEPRTGGEGEIRKEEGQVGGDPDAFLEPDRRERVLLAVDELGQLWIRYWGPRGLVDRHLAMPEHAAQIPLVVSLAVGNLVRQEAFELLRDLERRRAEQAEAGAREPFTPAKPPALQPQPALPKPSRAPPPRQRRNSWGNYLTGDLPYFASVNRACSPVSVVPCYDRDHARVFYDVPGAGIAGGVQSAHARYVMAYSRAITPTWSGSVRVGFAFSGGKAQNAAAEHDSALSKLMPWLLELRLQDYPLRAARNESLQPFVHLAAGVAQVSAEVKLTAPSAFDGTGAASAADAGTVTAVRTMGLVFVGAGLGASLYLFDQLRLEGELSGFLAFPSKGVGLRPSIGLAYDF